VVIEDNAVDALITRKTFESVMPEIEVHHFENGQDAIAYLADTHHEETFILLDMNMPVLGGLAFLEKKSKIDSIKDIPVAMLSSHYAPREKEKASRYHVKLFLEKPMLKETAQIAIKEMWQEDNCSS
jgi:CheY-like chemotaxis protein